MILPPKSKVEMSPHYFEIMEWHNEGMSSRSISLKLKNEYGEEIGHNAIARYMKNHINDEVLETVDRKLKQESREVKEPVVSDDERRATEQAIINDRVERQEAERGLVDANAEIYLGVFKVGRNFPEDYQAMKREAKDPDSRVNTKDVADMSLRAAKFASDLIKDDTSTEETISNGFQELADAIQRSREIQD